MSVRDPAALQAAAAALADDLAAAATPLLGVALAPVLLPNERREAAHDPRRVRPGLLALATEARTFVLDCPYLPDLRPLAPVLAGPRPPYVVFPDAHFYLTVLARLGLAPPRLGCTRTAALLLAEGTLARDDELEFHNLVERYLKRPFPARWKQGQIALFDGREYLDWDRGAVLAHTAGRATELLRAMTHDHLRPRGMSRAFELECKLLPAVVAMESAGVAVDGARFAAVADGWRREREATADPERQAQLDKLITSYANWPRDYIEKDGRMRPHLDPLGTDSGRFACSRPNLQQVPSEYKAPGLRACFRAAPGHTLVIADYAQIELRVAAHLAPCEALREVFRAGRDPHRATAATLARKPEAEVTPHERKLAKAINFGFLFGMGAERFRDYAQTHYDLALDLAAAERAREAFFSTFPGIAAWHRRVGAMSPREDNFVRTTLGRRKRFPAGHFSFNAALNIPVQGTAAEGFKRAMTALHPALAELGGRGVLCVHDEYLAEVPETHAEAARTLVQQTMQAAMAEVVPSVPIAVDSRVAPSWAE